MKQMHAMKTKTLFLIIITCAFSCQIIAQELTRTVVSSGGSYRSAGGYTLSATVGEIAVTTLKSETLYCAVIECQQSSALILAPKALKTILFCCTCDQGEHLAYGAVDSLVLGALQCHPDISTYRGLRWIESLNCTERHQKGSSHGWAGMAGQFYCIGEGVCELSITGPKQLGQWIIECNGGCGGKRVGSRNHHLL